MKRIGSTVFFAFLALGEAPAVAGTSAGGSFEFDGGSSFSISGQSLSPPAFTIEAWVYPASIAGRHVIYSSGNGCNEANNVTFAIEDGDLIVCVPADTETAPAGIVTNAWQHVAVTFDGAFLRFYKNGSIVAIRVPFLDPIFASNVATLGADSGTDFFEGEMDEFRLWTTDLSNNQIQDNMFRPLVGTEADLLLYYRFDEGMGGTIHDSASFGLFADGTLTGTEIWQTSRAVVTALSTHTTNVFGIWAEVPSSAPQTTPTGLRVDDDSFLNDEGDDLVFGHSGAGFGLSTSEVPSAVGTRWNRVFQFEASDVGSNLGSIVLGFDESDAGGPGALDPSKLYYLLTRPVGSSDEFTVVSTAPVAGPDAVEFTLDVSQLDAAAEYTLGIMADTSMGLYFDPGYTQTSLVDQPLFTPFDAWLVIKGVTADSPGEGISGWETLVVLPPGLSVVSATLIPPGSTNSGDPGDLEWIVDAGTCVEPDGNGDIAVLQYSLQLIDRPSTDVTITFAAPSPSSFDPPAAGWRDCASSLASFTSFDEATLSLPSPAIDSVDDIPDDQGGWVRVTVDRSTLDDSSWGAQAVTGYNLWREVTNPKTVDAIGTSGTPLASDREIPGLELLQTWEAREWQGRVFLTRTDAGKTLGSVPPGTWEILTSFFAIQQPQYLIAAATTMDAVPTAFFVSAHTDDPLIWYGSEPESGISIDNIAPAPPQNITAGYQANGVDLLWDPAPEADFQFYRVYRGTDPGFTPEAGNLVQETATAAWTDPTANPWGFFYKITTLDFALNESLPGSPQTVTGANAAPTRFALHDVVPNPFNPRARIAFSLVSEARVDLAVYDVAGRLVRRLIDESMPAGRHDVTWEGIDRDGAPVASGVYLFRIHAGSFTATARATLVK